MTGRGSCVPLDRLTALALAGGASHAEHDRYLLAHVAACEACRARLASLTAEMDALREEAFQEADEIFTDDMLDSQRARILARLAHLGHAARVLRFPGRVREATMPVSPISRRWISVAAAAGLIIGLVAGQMIHFVPWDAPVHRAATTVPQMQASAPRDGTSGVLMQATSAVVTSSDEELLDEIDEAVQLRRAASLRALDAFTPRVGDLVEIR